jgi:hypothetical protein
MKTIRLRGSERACDGVSRRDFVKVGALSFLGLALPEFLRLEQAAAAGRAPGAPGPRAKSCILVWLGGGPSHIDTFDPKPDAPPEWRGEFRPIGTKAGFQICEHLPRLAAESDKYSLLRSVTHGIGAHELGTHLMLTGYRQFAGDEYPGYGSVAARVFGWDRTIPPYVAIPDMIGDAGPGYLGAEGSPFIAGDPGNGNYQVANITLAGGVNEARLSRRRAFLRDADTLHREDRADDPVAGMQRFYEKAYDLITSAETKKAFDIHKEVPKLRDEYGRHGVGQGCLLARRLVESGVRFVTVQRGGWDNHGSIFPVLRGGNLPQLDQALAALLRDLQSRGMLQDTLVLCMGEFGRTPKLNATAGRDHWPKVQTVIVAGGGLKGGMVVGKSDAKAEEPVERPITPEDLAFTLFHCLGIKPETTFTTATGRPMKVAQNGSVIQELL